MPILYRFQLSFNLIFYALIVVIIFNSSIQAFQCDELTNKFPLKTGKDAYNYDIKYIEQTHK